MTIAVKADCQKVIGGINMDKIFLLSQISLFDELSMDDLKLIDTMSEMKPVKKVR